MRLLYPTRTYLSSYHRLVEELPTHHLYSICAVHHCHADLTHWGVGLRLYSCASYCSTTRALKNFVSMSEQLKTLSYVSRGGCGLKVSMCSA